MAGSTSCWLRGKCHHAPPPLSPSWQHQPPSRASSSLESGRQLGRHFSSLPISPAQRCLGWEPTWVCRWLFACVGSLYQQAGILVLSKTPISSRALGCPSSMGLGEITTCPQLQGKHGCSLWVGPAFSVLVLVCPALTPSKGSPHLDPSQAALSAPHQLPQVWTWDPKGGLGGRKACHTGPEIQEGLLLIGLECMYVHM